ncbi:MAG TPA: fatty acid desaturase, partial [Vicinamibacterales bacterium]|nr:fatty acid desaturase [Vicinamibacterales bacterium]
AAAAPVVGFLRFAVAAPLGWLLPSVRRFVRGRLSALVINPEYVRHEPLPPGTNIQEAAACAFCWTAAGLWFTGVLPAAAVACWACGTAAASLVNGIRTIAAHRYENEAEQLTMVEQLLDSCTIVARTTPMRVAVEFGHAMVAPVGLRYHSLHHWIPALPYHRLGAAHRRLTAALCPDAPYRSTVFPGFAPVIRTLFDRAGSRR